MPIKVRTTKGTLSLDTRDAHLSDEEARNVAAVEYWANLYNVDAARAVKEHYAEDCVVTFPGWMVYRGRNSVAWAEGSSFERNPNRYLTVRNVMAKGDRVVVEGDIRDPDKGSNFHTPIVWILTFRDGLVTGATIYLDIQAFRHFGLAAPVLDGQAAELDITVIDVLGRV